MIEENQNEKQEALHPKYSKEDLVNRRSDLMVEDEETPMKNFVDQSLRGLYLISNEYDSDDVSADNTINGSLNQDLYCLSESEELRDELQIYNVIHGGRAEANADANIFNEDQYLLNSD